MALPSDPAPEAGDPLALLRAWIAEAERSGTLARAAALATADSEGRPSVRMVMVPEAGPEGLVFYTDRGSRKGTELAANSWAALCFHWPALGRQLRAEGGVEALAAVASNRYFASRPRSSQLAAAISQQSQPVGQRAELQTRMEALAAELAGRPVPRPPTWGGYRVRPTAFEFWTQGPDRLHHRVRFRRQRQGWVRDLLQP